jgi:hypothetical protein
MKGIGRSSSVANWTLQAIVIRGILKPLTPAAILLTQGKSLAIQLWDPLPHFPKL